MGAAAQSKELIVIETGGMASYSTPKRNLVNTTKNDFGLPPLVHTHNGGNFMFNKKSPYLQKVTNIRTQMNSPDVQRTSRLTKSVMTPADSLRDGASSTSKHMGAALNPFIDQVLVSNDSDTFRNSFNF